MKNRYKYSLIFLTGVDMTHACICRYRCGFVGAAAQTTAGPGLRPCLRLITIVTPVSSAKEKSRDDIRRGITSFTQGIPFYTTAGPYSPFHHCAPVSPGTGITPRRDQTPVGS